MESFLLSTGDELRSELIICEWQTSAKTLKHILESGSILLAAAAAVFAVFVFVFAVFVKGPKRDNFYSFYKVVAFWWVPRGSRICPRPLCCFPRICRAPPVFVQITGKMGPLYHFVWRVRWISTLPFYIPSPIVGNFPFTVASVRIKVRKDEAIVAAFQTNHTGVRGG